MRDTVDLRRRRLIAQAGTIGVAATLAPVCLRADESAAQAELALAQTAHGREIPPHLIGLSYEARHLLDAGLFSPKNTDLIAYFRTLNPRGILRIGGNTSDFAVWSEYRGELPAAADAKEKAGHHRYAITPAQIEDLAGFARATGWRVIFGVNLKIDVPPMAAQLAAEVQRRLGENLLAIQIGNEPNNFRNAARKEISFDEYLALWKRSARAVREAVPGIALAGPDTGANTDWVLRFAAEVDGIVALSRHYYRGGADDAGTTIADLLSGDANFVGDVASMAVADGKRNLPLYLSEVNSYWSGGKLGVSNTLASALWGGDFALACAQAGADGVQFHGGPLAALEISLDRVRHPVLGEGDYKSRIDGISGRYTAIAGDVGAGFYARPLYYGALLARQFAGARFVETSLKANGVNLAAYAAERDRRRMVAVFNKDLARDVQLRIALGRAARSAQVWRLTAPAIDNVHEVALAGAEVDSRGRWSPKRIERLVVTGAATSLRVPRGSAVLVFAE
ncbi:MAG: hypothetical protein QM741_03330 [Rudaea sp.]|uniref:hypothetical protein n=1 Tax=Rudaea sp. TaxID=2136325 RepID=UPI0039E6A199